MGILGETLTAVPLVKVILPGVNRAVPLLKTAVSVVEAPWVKYAAVAVVVKLVMVGSATVLEEPTLIDTVLVTDTPAEFVTVSV